MASGAAAPPPAPLQKLEELTSLTAGELRFGIGILASLPIGALLGKLPPGRPRHACAAATGIALCTLIFGQAVVNLLGPALATYLVMVVHQRQAGYITWIGGFAFLVYQHIVNTSGLNWARGDIDFTGTLMMLTVRLITCAVSWQDGLLKKEECLEYQREYQIREMPGPLEFMVIRSSSTSISSILLSSYSIGLVAQAYALHPCQVLAGPWIEFSAYREWSRDEGVWSHYSHRGQTRATLEPLVIALGALISYVVVKPYVPVELLISDRFRAMPFAFRLLTLAVYMMNYRARFYFVWKVSEAGNNASGLGFYGYRKGKPDWTRARNVDIQGVECATSGVLLPHNWNINTGLWLRHYVYERLVVKGKKPTFFVLFLTQTVSGVWHGLYAGYWMFFVGSSFMLQASRSFYRLERLLKNPWGKMIRYLHMFLTRLHVDFLGCCFTMVQLDKALNALRALNFIGFFTTAIMLLPWPWIAKALGAREERMNNEETADSSDHSPANDHKKYS